MAHNKIYALYDNEEILSVGTMKEIAENLGLSHATIIYYNCKSYKERLKEREEKGFKVGRILIELEYD